MKYMGKQFGTQLYVLQGLSTLCWEGVEEDGGIDAIAYFVKS